VAHIEKEVELVEVVETPELNKKNRQAERKHEDARGCALETSRTSKGSMRRG